MATRRTEELIKKDAKHFIHPFGQAGFETKIIWEKAEGVTLWDTEGREYLDFCSQFQCSSLGYRRKELYDAAIEQMNKLEFVAQPNPYSTITAIEFAAELAKFTPKNINHFFFTVAGTESNEQVLKMAKFYWGLKGKASKYKVICLNYGYHGCGLLTSSITGFPHPRDYSGPEALGVVRIPNYHCYRCAFGLKYPDCGVACAKYLEVAIEQEEEDTVAAFIAEPELGGGGAIAPPPQYWPMVREICTKHNILLIDDEVMSGFCRTGKHFTIEHWDVEPDFLIMGKGINGNYLPLGAVGISDKVYKELDGKVFYSGSTNMGQPVAIATARAALNVYLKEHICEHVTKVGNHVRERLEKEFLPLPCVGEINGLGLFLSFAVVANKTNKAPFSPAVVSDIRYKASENGLFIRVTRDQRRVFVTPPLIITEEEADRGLDILYPIIAGLKPE